MRMRINGEDKVVDDGMTVADLVASLGLAGRRVAVERNREVLPASRWNERLVEDDVLEIVHFVGGG